MCLTSMVTLGATVGGFAVVLSARRRVVEKVRIWTRVRGERRAVHLAQT